MSENAIQQHQFQTEVKKLLQIITHSLYTHREIFLRELVSNASDALDKLRFEQARGTEVVQSGLPLEIRITTDKDGKRLVIEDTGIGMTSQELMDNLGTIARSGSEEFINQMATAAKKGDDKAEAALIGRFGVGFYSVFMVADLVEVKSRSARPGEKPWKWSSDGGGAYALTPLADDEAPARGTRIDIQLKDEAQEYAEKYRVESVVKKHSSFISFPILLDGDKVNTIPALWREPKFQVTEQQYTEFYKFLSMDNDPPLDTIHVSVDAPVQFTSLCFIPKRSYDLMGMNRDRWGMDLYVRRVLIQRENKDIIPEYLGFLKGLVDTEDLPLNISRETLQENVVLRKIGQTLTKQVLSHLEKMAQDKKEEYADFWRAHGGLFKYGYNDYANKDRIAPLLRFNSSAHEDKDGLTSLDEYIARMKPGQKDIYHVAGVSREAVKLNPHMELLRRKGVEVLFLYDPVDEFVMDTLREYKEHPLKSVEHAEAESLKDLPDTGEAKPKAEAMDEQESKDMDGLLARIKEILGERVTEVKISQRLSDSPACLANPESGMTSSMEKLMKAMTKDSTPPRKGLEINPDHPLTRNLLKVFQKDPQDAFLQTAVEQMYESALLLEGYLTDPHALVARITGLLEQSSGWYKDIKGL